MNRDGGETRMLVFTPDQFIDLLERERRWCEFVLTAMSMRVELRSKDARRMADDTVAMFLELRARALKN